MLARIVVKLFYKHYYLLYNSDSFHTGIQDAQTTKNQLLRVQKQIDSSNIYGDSYVNNWYVD